MIALDRPRLRPRGFPLGLAVLLVAATAQAQTKSGAILPGGNSKQPINIQATKLDYFDKEQKLVYTGNVLAVQARASSSAARW